MDHISVDPYLACEGLPCRVCVFMRKSLFVMGGGREKKKKRGREDRVKGKKKMGEGEEGRERINKRECEWAREGKGDIGGGGEV